MILLIEKMSDIQMDSRNLVLVLSTFNELLGHSSFKMILTQQVIETLIIIYFSIVLCIFYSF